jgi:hypothetical protein
VRQLSIGAGDKVPVGALLAKFSKTADEITAGSGRPLRTTVVGVMKEWQPW